MSDMSQRERELLTELAALRRRMAREETKEFDSSAGSAGTAATFLELADTPSSYAGAANYFARVNSAGTALVFGTVDWGDVYNKVNAGTATLGVAAFTSSDFTVSGGTVSIQDSGIDHGSIGGLGDDDHAQYHNNARGDARYYTETEVQTSGSAAIHYNNLTNVPVAGTATRGIAAFNNGNFTVNGGTASLGTIYPRYSGAPTAGAMAYWTANGTIAAASFGTAPFVQYSGTAGAGALAYWTGTGTVTANGGFGTADLVLTSGAQAVAGVKRFSDEIRTGNSSTVYLEQKQAGVTITNSTWTSVLTGLTGVSIVYFQLNSNATNFGGVFYIINNAGTITITPLASTNMVAGAPAGFQVGYQASTTALQMQAGPSWPATIGCNVAACRLVW